MAQQDNLVTNTHPEYDEAMPFRCIWEDVMEGTAVVRKAGTKYLPKFPKETANSYNLRKDTATFLNVTKKTVKSLCGLVFTKDITLLDDVPAEIAGSETTSGIVENIDNKGNHLNVFARDLFEESFDGCAGFLVDSPTLKAATDGERVRLGQQPYWIAYCAEDIINWDYTINPVNKKTELSFVVLREYRTQRSNQFVRTSKIQYRVLMLDDQRRPVWELWEETADDQPGMQQMDFGNKPMAQQKRYKRTQTGTFEKQTRIPFAIVGDLCDKPPLMDLCYKNIEHYQTYSDYKSVLHKCCRPLFYSINLEGEPSALGSDIWFKCNEGGSIGFAEPAGTSIDKVERSLQVIKQEMALLGLSMLVSDRRANAEITATEKMLDSIQETSELQVRATQLKDALELGLSFTAQYLGLGADAGGSIELGATWAELIISPQELTALSGLVDLGQLSLESMLWYLEKGGKLPPDVTAEDELTRIKGELQDTTLNPPEPAPTILNPNSPPGMINKVTKPQGQNMMNKQGMNKQAA